MLEGRTWQVPVLANAGVYPDASMYPDELERQDHLLAEEAAAEDGNARIVARLASASPRSTEHTNGVHATEASVLVATMQACGSTHLSSLYGSSLIWGAWQSAGAQISSAGKIRAEC
jgi:hypothetical protein